MKTLDDWTDNEIISAIVDNICLEYALNDRKKVRKMVKTALAFDNVQQAIKEQVESYLQSVDYLVR